MRRPGYEIGPIFIVGMNGSGTTMMADCLNNHPLIFVPRYESKIIPYYYYNLKDYGDLKNEKNFNKLLYEFSNAHIFRNLNGTSDSVNIQYDYKTINEKNLASVIDLTFAYFAQRQRKLIWADHSPKYAICQDILVDLFPRCKIIHLIRDARDCALSFSRRFNQNIYRTAFQWKKIVQKARRDGLRLGQERYFEIRYEDLTTNPIRYMKLLFTFLELPFDHAVLNSKMPMYRNRDLQKVDVNTIITNSGKWKLGLSEKQVRQIEEIAGQTMKQFGYEIEFVAGNSDIPKGKLRILQLIDKLTGAYIAFKEDSGKNRLSRLSRVALSAIKQMNYFKY